MSVVDTNIKQTEARLTGAHDKENFDTLNTLITHYMRIDPVKAMDFAKQALATARKLNTLEELSQVWYALGALNLILGQTNAALPFLKKAVNALDELGDFAKKTRAMGILPMLTTTPVR